MYWVHPLNDNRLGLGLTHTVQSIVMVKVRILCMRRLSDGGEAEKSEDVERYSTVDMITYCEIKEQSMSS